MAVFNNSNEDSFEKSLSEIRMHQSGPVDSKLWGIDPRLPAAMINDFDTIEENEEVSYDNEIITGSPLHNSTMLNVEEVPEMMSSNLYHLNSADLMNRLHSSIPQSVTVCDTGSGVPIHVSSCNCSSTETGECVSIDSFTGTVKIVSQSVPSNEVEVNKKDVQKIQNDMLTQQLKIEEINNRNIAISESNLELEKKLKSLSKETRDHQDKVKELKFKNNNLLEDSKNCGRLLDEAKRFEISAMNGAEQVVNTLNMAYEEQLEYNEMQKSDIDHMNQKIRTLTNERKNFLKLAEDRLRRYNNKATISIDKLVRAHERAIALGHSRTKEIDALDKKISRACKKNEKLEGASKNYGDYSSHISKLEKSCEAIQARVRLVSTVNSDLLAKNRRLSMISGEAGNSDFPLMSGNFKTRTTVGLPDTKAGHVKYGTNNVSFSGFDSSKYADFPALNKTF